MATDVRGDKVSGETDNGPSGPVKVGGKYSSTQPTYADGQRTEFQTDTRGNQKVVIMQENAASSDRVLAGTVDMAASSLSASTAISITNTNYAGIFAWMNVTSAFPGSASTTYTLKIKAVSPLSAGATIIIGAAAARSTSGMSSLVIYPGILNSAGANAQVSMVLPRELQIVASLSSGATSKEVVLSLGHTFLP